MTTEEIEEFKKTIEKSILPHIINLNTKQISDIVHNTPDVPEEFKNMLLEQLFILKEKNMKQQIKH